MLAQYPLGYEGYHVPIEVPLSEFDEVEPEPLGLGLGQVRAGDEPQREQDLAEILPGIVLLGLQRQAHLLLAYLALVDEDVGDLIDSGPLTVRYLRIRDTPPELDLPA